METVFPLYSPAQALKDQPNAGLEAWEYIEYHVKHVACEYRLPVRLFITAAFYLRGATILWKT